MSSKKNIFSELKWISDISKRFARVDSKGRAAVTSKLATTGICLGVMTLIVVMSVMNGFQMSFIDSILEISSYHVRSDSLTVEEGKKLKEFAKDNKLISSVTEFYEAQTLMTSEYGREKGAVIRAINPEDVFNNDKGFRKELKIRSGYFDLQDEDSIVLGHSLARELSVGIGDTVNLFVMSGGNDVDLFSGQRNFTVTGTFVTGYNEINSNYCFVNIGNASKYFGEQAKVNYGIKLGDSNKDGLAISRLEKAVAPGKFQSWRDYNKSFFGALKIEKNMLLLLVAIIFIVVAVNIYNGMRRLVFERKNEIAILSALGAGSTEIKSIFIMRGFFMGATGALVGVLLGLFISVNTDVMFNAVSSIMYYIQYAITAITAPENLIFVRENSTYALYASIPARIYFSEVLSIALFGVLAPLIACWAASKNVLKMTVAEVLHDE